MAAQTPFGATVAHGYLTLSLLPQMSYRSLPHDDPGAGMALNYGLQSRAAPGAGALGLARSRLVPSSARVDEEDWGRQVTMTATIEREDGDKPVCVAEVVYRYYRL